MEKKEQNNKCIMCLKQIEIHKCEKCDNNLCCNIECMKLHNLLCISEKSISEIKERNIKEIKENESILSLIRLFISRRKRDIIHMGIINYLKILCIKHLNGDGLVIIGHIIQRKEELLKTLTKEEIELLEDKDYRFVIVDHYIHIDGRDLTNYIGYSTICVEREENNNEIVIETGIELAKHAYRDNSGILIDCQYTDEVKKFLYNTKEKRLLGIKVSEFYKIYVEEGEKVK